MGGQQPSLFSFGFGNKQQQPLDETNKFELSLHMLIDDLPPEFSNDLVSIFNSSVSTINTISTVTNTQSDFESLSKRVESALFGPLMSLARMTDMNFSNVKKLKDELACSREEVNEAGFAKSIPTPFLVRSIHSIRSEADDISQKISALHSRFSHKVTSSFFPEYLDEQNKAILRLASRLSRLREEASKMHSSRLTSFSEPMDFQMDKSCAEEIQSQYDEWIGEKRMKREMRAEEANLYGFAPIVYVPTTTPFGGTFGSLGSGPSISVPKNISNPLKGRPQSSN